MTAVMYANSLTAPRYLIFFPSGSDSSEIEEGLNAFRSATERSLDLTDSLAWYEARFAACGNWDSWSLEAVTGLSYRHRRPYFDGFGLVGPRVVGRGTARTLSLALQLGKPVYWLDDKKLLPVRAVTQESGEWHIQTGAKR